jgi:hypothetical protein
MAVRNIGGFGKPKPIPVIHFIPPRFSPVWKVEIATDTETIDVTEIVFSGEFSDGVTDNIGDFVFRLLDPSNNVSNRIEEFDTVNIYMDYGKTATTLRFVGKIERKSNAEQIFLDISGRSVAMITTGTNVTYSSSGLKARSEILTEIIELRFSGLIATTGIEEDLVEIEVNYSEIPFWQIVAEICNGADRDAYVGTDLVFNYFARGSKYNRTEAVVENINLVEAFDFAKDTEEIVTKVRVYGNIDGNVPIIYSSGSNTSQTKGIVKEYKQNISGIVTPAQAKDLAISKAASNLVAPTLGTISSMMLPTLLPGEKVKIANPTNNIPPADYEINSFRHMFSEDGAPTTTLVIKKERASVSRILKSNYVFQNDITDDINPLEMDYTVILDYRRQVSTTGNAVIGEGYFAQGVFDNVETEVSSTGNGVLKTVSGETGSWTSPEIQTEGLVSKISLNHNSEYIGATKFFVSLDRGLKFVEIGSAAGNFTFDSPQNSIIIKADIKSSSTRIEKIGINYSTD